MKNGNLKNIFAMMALGLGMMMPLAEANAGPVIVTGGSDRDRVEARIPGNSSYETYLYHMAPEQYQVFKKFNSALADMSSTAEDLQKIIGKEKFKDFDAGEVKRLVKAREDVLGSFSGRANAYQMNEVWSQYYYLRRLASMRTGAIIAVGAMGCLVGGAYVFDKSTR